MLEKDYIKNYKGLGKIYLLPRKQKSIRLFFKNSQTIVHFPANMPLKIVEEFIESKTDWIKMNQPKT